ncbi:hypothetical protein ABT063_25615 [Streptomyces sp. NPDC002838]|uniref:hypothetical protein n=1 Tax=Streptomyces sp. NPDC002838 TaxID=3154436 RepID=UPI003319B857
MLEQRSRGRIGRIPPTVRLARGAALAGCLALLPLATACGGGGDDDAVKSGPTKTSVTAAPAAGVVAPAKVEVIAGLTGCKVKIRVEAEQLREGVCHTEKGDYLITTFPRDKYQQTWLESASVYGGKYLVGARWVVAAKPKMLEQFRAKLGGTIQQMRGMGPTPGPSAS